MSVEIIKQRLLAFNCETVLDQDNALKEIAQEIALMALSRAGFFRIAAFQGGTCLRILHGLERFSEDLDFVLLEPDKTFDWHDYVKNMHEEFNAYGYDLEVTNKRRLDKVIKSAFLKADSQGGLLVLKDNRSNKVRLKIKLEIDTNPPEGSQYELKYLDFPMAYSVQVQDLPSMFASKSHALLCRDYVKGRDWYDFIWYVSRKVSVNFKLLSNAVNQSGPWKGHDILVDREWYLAKMEEKIIGINWNKAKEDVARFLRSRELASLEVWSKEFFLSRLEKLADTLHEKE